MTGTSIRRSEMQCLGAEGRRIFRRAWLPEDPERVLLVVHGYAEHSGRYEGLATWFAARGIAVHAYDHQGHGNSAGRRCHVRRFADFLDDLHCVLDRIREEHPGLRVSIAGHSMGGLITAAFLVDRRPAIASAVLSAAPLALGPGVSRGRVIAARLLRRIMPRVTLGSGIDPDGLSRDPEVVRAYLEDPLVFRTMTASLGASLLEAIPETAERAGEVEVPVLVLHGEADTVCVPAGSQAFYEKLSVPESALRLYPELRHEIFNEPEREKVYGDVYDWLVALDS